MPLLIPSYFRRQGYGYAMSGTNAEFSRKEVILCQLEVHPDKVDRSLPHEAIAVADQCSRILNQMIAQESVCRLCRSRFSCNECKLSVSLTEIHSIIKQSK